MNANFNVRKMCSTVEIMDGCEYSIEIIVAHLKERIARSNFFLKINILLLKQLQKQWITSSFPVKINTVHFKEWMAVIPFVSKIDALLQGINGCN